MRKKIPTRYGLTLIELIVTTAISAAVITAVAFVLIDSQRCSLKVYRRIYGDVVTDAYVARKAFSAVIRKASKDGLLLDESGNWIEVNYYADDDSAVVDRYARFYESDGALNLEYGILEPKETLSVHTVCGNVSGCVFKAAGRSAQMMLTLDDGSQAITTVSSAFMHNQ